MKRLLTLALLALASMAGMVQAQQSNLLYGSDRIPQANTLNPAFFPNTNKFYLALPGVNLMAGLPVSYADVFKYDAASNTTTINANSIMDSLAHNGLLRTNLNLYAIGFGMKLGQGFVTASVQAKMNARAGFPSGILDFAMHGNMNNLGEGNELYLIDGSLLNAQLYGEAAIGYARKIGDFTVGAKAKMLLGYADLSTQGTQATLYTAEDLSSLRADLNIRANMSTALTGFRINDDFSVTTDGLGVNYFPENRGFAFDLGGRYQNRLFDISASILDLGGTIHWKENVQTLRSAHNENSVSFNGIDVSGMITNGQFNDTIFKPYMDSLMSMIETQMVDGEEYTSKVPTKFNAAAFVKPLNSFKAGVIFYGELDPVIRQVRREGNTDLGAFASNTTLMANLNLKNWVELMVSFSVVGNGQKVNWFNPGVGVNLSLFKTVQFYAIMDYMSSIYLVDMKSFNMYAGLNLLIGNRFKERSTEQKGETIL